MARKALESVPGVRKAVINFNKKQATVRYDPSKATTAAMAKALQGVGYDGAPKS